MDERRGASPRVELLKEQNKGTADHREAGDGQLMRLFSFFRRGFAWLEILEGQELNGFMDVGSPAQLLPQRRVGLIQSPEQS